MQAYFTNSMTDMHGRYLAFERDAKGLPITVTDEQDKKTAFTYDRQGHATEITGPDGLKNASVIQTAC